MDNFFEILNTYPSMKSVFNFWDVILNFLVPFICMIPMTYIYKRTHKGVTYNQAFTHTVFIMAVTTSIIMMIIGSNIARAFSLVGALSIIRFRTAVKDSRDTGYIFGAIAIGMASGTGMYMVAIEFTFLFCIMLLALNYFRVGEKVAFDKVLKLKGNEKINQGDLDKFLLGHVENYSLVHSEVINDSGGQVLTYIISTVGNDKDDQILNDLKSKFKIDSSSIFYNDQRVEI